MKEINEINLPDDLKYSKDHEWARFENQYVTIGVTDYAQDQLGDIVFVELPQKGDVFKKGDEFGNVESIKAVSELYMPLGGKIFEVNAAFENHPDLANTSPYEKGWMIKVENDNADNINDLMGKDKYYKYLQGIE